MFSSIVLTKVIQKIKTRLFEFDKVIIVRPTYVYLKGFGQKLMRIMYGSVFNYQTTNEITYI